MMAAALLLSIPVGGIERFSFVDWDALKELLDGCSSGYDNYYSYTNIQNRYKVNAPGAPSWWTCTYFFFHINPLIMVYFTYFVYSFIACWVQFLV